jgi:hypothetical protein
MSCCSGTLCMLCASKRCAHRPMRAQEEKAEQYPQKAVVGVAVEAEGVAEGCDRGRVGGW